MAPCTRDGFCRTFQSKRRRCFLSYTVLDTGYFIRAGISFIRRNTSERRNTLTVGFSFFSKNPVQFEYVDMNDKYLNLLPIHVDDRRLSRKKKRTGSPNDETMLNPVPPAGM